MRIILLGGGGLIGLTKYLEIAKNRLIFFKKR